MVKKLLCSTVAIVAIACGSTLADVVAERRSGHGTAQVYNVVPDQAYELAKVVLRSEGTETIEEHRAEGYLLTSTPAKIGYTPGSNVGVWIESMGPAPFARVVVVTKRKASLDVATGLTEEQFQRDFGRAVASTQQR